MVGNGNTRKAQTTRVSHKTGKNLSPLQAAPISAYVLIGHHPAPPPITNVNNTQQSDM